ncbi:SMC-Scp complex subunit ScpB [Candidatus Kaiserbacteria bacterium]|nr:SMC-Scp complex subunit ScpB [Candidatus Kaiserbacteria bacterium]
MSGLDLAQKASAFLFAEGGELAHKKLSTLMGCSEAELGDALKIVAERLQGSGIGLIATDTSVCLSVSEEASSAVQEALKRELDHDIGEAGLEVLSIVLYVGPSTRAKIDYIRGVNSSSTLRNLLARGLLERIGNPEDAREYLYRPSIELLSHLGVTDATKLPDYATILAELASFEQKNREAHDGRTDAIENA